MKPFPKELSLRHKRFLGRLFPGDACLLTPEGAVAFGADSSRCFAPPFAVVRPERLDQVRELLAWAQAERMPLYPRSRGTGMVGGSVPVMGGLVVSCLRMNRVKEIDPDDFVAVVEPGVVTAELKALAAEKGLFYPPDPASVKISTIGGNMATCAGGMCALKYGVTRDFVLGLEMVLPGGRVLRTGGRSHKNVVGLDLTRLLVGSAGTLALVSEITLKLLPLPESTATVLACFGSLEQAMAGAHAVFRAGILPAALEFMDDMAVKAVALASDPPWPETPGAVLLFRLDGGSAAVAVEAERLEKVLSAVSPLDLIRAQGPDEERLWEARRLISPASFQFGPDKLGEDVAVPRGRTAEAVAGFRDIGQRHGLAVVCFGHLGDGNIHVNIMYDARDQAQNLAAARAKEEVFRLSLSLGGTLSGEHGTGLTKKDYLSWQLGEAEMEVMSGLKAVFDPAGIMNPGKGW
ncbi:MAG: FAD-binding protein [Desulfovibrionaceae bacterium]|nr:FAD-binding protein [Desulfovibrionaceae bacterium]